MIVEQLIEIGVFLGVKELNGGLCFFISSIESEHQHLGLNSLLDKIILLLECLLELNLSLVTYEWIYQFKLVSLIDGTFCF